MVAAEEATDQETALRTEANVKFARESDIGSQFAEARQRTLAKARKNQDSDLSQEIEVVAMMLCGKKSRRVEYSDKCSPIS